MNRIAALQQERASWKLAFEAAWRTHDAQAEMIAVLELERVDAEIKRELAAIERADE